MDDAELKDLLTAQTRLMATLFAAHHALERVVFALVQTHPQTATFIAQLKQELAASAVSDPASPLLPEVARAHEEQRARILDKLERLVS